MQFEVRSPEGVILYTQADLERALAARSAERILPPWMRALVWPKGMLDAMRAARHQRQCSALRAILIEARMLSDAEQAGLTTAAAAIRHVLRGKYADVDPGEG